MTTNPPTAKATADVPETSRIEKLGLSHMFREGSASSAAAELLLTGNPITKAEIMRQTGVVETVVPRMITWLRRAGIEVSSTRDPRTRQVTYQANVPAIGQPPADSFEFHTKGPAVLVRATGMTMGEGEQSRHKHAAPTVTITLESELGTVTGATTVNPLLPDLTTDGMILSRVILRPGGKQEWMLGFLPKAILVSDVTFIAGP